MESAMAELWIRTGGSLPISHNYPSLQVTSSSPFSPKNYTHTHTLEYTCAGSDTHSVHIQLNI